MAANNNHSSERLSAGLAETINARWGVVYRAVDNEHRATFSEKPQLFSSNDTKTTPQEVGGHDSVYDSTAYREQRVGNQSAAAAGVSYETSEERQQGLMASTARADISEIHGGKPSDEEPDELTA
jgi:hypothetical protein